MHLLIIDDDIIIREQLAHYTRKAQPSATISQADNGLEALKLMQEVDFDMIVLDIDMPEMRGDKLLETLRPDCPIVVVTSDSDFAVQSYNYNVVDYLLKPVEFERFFQALRKARQAMPSSAPAESGQAPDHIFVKDGRGLSKVELANVLYIEAASNYVSFVSPTGSTMSLLSMKKLAEELPSNFVRIHRSYIVNINGIDKVDGADVHIGGKQLPLSPSYRDELLRRLRLLQ